MTDRLPATRGRGGSGALRRLILLGGGHAHLAVLARLRREPLAGVDVLLVSPFEYHHYSGMVPGFLAGTYAEEDLAFDLRELARRANAQFVPAAAERVDVAGRSIEAGGVRLPFDLLSIDVGSESAALATPGARDHALAVRPMSRAVGLRRRAEALFTAAGAATVPVVVVGAGAAGVEVALAIDRLGRHLGAQPRVSLVDREQSVLPEFSARLRRRATGLLAARGIGLALGRGVARVEADGVVLDDGERRPAALTAWVAGAAAPSLLAPSDVPKDGRGYLQVDDTLRAIDGSPVFGAGDCIGILGHPGLAKAGVYAVREAPILDHNLRAALGGRPPRRYRPQRTFLALLNTADGRALWRWRRFSGYSRLAWRLKDLVDRGFIERLREPR